MAKTCAKCGKKIRWLEYDFTDGDGEPLCNKCHQEYMQEIHNEYEPKVLYETAYNLHYKQYDLEMALDKYKEVIERFPDTSEAGYAETQIENIQEMSEAEKKSI